MTRGARSRPGHRPAHRRLAFLAAAALAWLPVTAPAQSPANGSGDAIKPAERIFRYLDEAVRIVPGRGLGRVAIGTPLAAVVQAWGAPRRSDRSGFLDRQTTMLFDAGLNAWIMVRGDETVETIGIEGRTGYSTAEGVRFGMPRHQVAMVYGQPEKTQEGAYRYPERGIAFNFRSGTVYQIEVFAPEARGE